MDDVLALDPVDGGAEVEPDLPPDDTLTETWQHWLPQDVETEHADDPADEPRLGGRRLP
jgi:hypothetical protein